MRPSDLTPERWAEADRIFGEALEAAPTDRERFVARACGGDLDLRAEVDALLAAHERAEGYFVELDPESTLESILGEQVPAGGARLARFHVEREIGRGGMGVVYRALDTRLRRRVALKVLRPWVGSEPSARRRFEAEARAVSALDHPNIATLHEIGETEDGQAYMVFALYEGRTLADRLSAGAMNLDEAIPILIAVANGLAAAHARGIVHRDVKPSNILLTDTGEVRLLDFGAAKSPGLTITGEGVRLGTAAYMSPEQAAGRAVDARSDLWSVGVVMVEMLTGRRPFDGDDYAAMLHAILYEEPDFPPDDMLLPPGARAIVTKLLRKRADERFGSARELITALDAVGDGRSPTVAPEGTRSPRLGRYAKALGVAAALVLTALVGERRWRASTGGGGPDPLVTEAVLLGTYHRDRRSPADLALARRYYERALALDSGAAPAYAGLAATHAIAAAWGLEGAHEAYPKAEELASTALRLDSSTVDAYETLAMVALRYDWDWALGERLSRRALELDENSVPAHRLLATALEATGRLQEASAIAARGEAIDALPTEVEMGRAFRAYASRDFERAVVAATAALDFDPEIWQAPMLIGLAHVEQEQSEDAVARAEEAVVRSNRSPVALSALGYVYARAGHPDEAWGVVQELSRRRASEYVAPSRLALVHGALGDSDGAIAWLDRAYHERDAMLIQVVSYPFFDPLRGAPRFDEILSGMGLSAAIPPTS